MSPGMTRGWAIRLFCFSSVCALVREQWALDDFGLGRFDLGKELCAAFAPTGVLLLLALFQMRLAQACRNLWPVFVPARTTQQIA